MAARRADVVIGAVGADRWEVEIFGRASHAGGAPERGISATMILAEALAEVRAGGWFGKVEKDGRKGTSNVGPVGGANDGPAGDATNVVTDYVLVRGESRSHDAKFFREITTAYRAAFSEAAAAVTNSEGKAGRVKFTTRTDYYPFRLKETAPVVTRAKAAVAAQGHTPNVRVTNGGLDANWLVRHGIPTVTFGAGQNEAHTVDEWINLAEFEVGLPPRRRARDARVNRHPGRCATLSARRSMRPGALAAEAEVVGVGLAHGAAGLGLRQAIGDAVALGVGDRLLLGVEGSGGSAISCRASWSSPSAGRSRAAPPARTRAPIPWCGPGPTAWRSGRACRCGRPSSAILWQSTSPPRKGGRPRMSRWP